LLRWWGLPSEICSGLRYDIDENDITQAHERPQQKIVGHMWVEHHGVVINDRLDVRTFHMLDISAELDPRKPLMADEKLFSQQ
jgi:hypothetical protein